jgi:hypothetical protein
MINEYKDGKLLPKRTQPMRPEWRNSDPRLDWMDVKRISIVILRPSSEGNGKWEAGTGHCEMKHGWSISTSYDNHSYVGEGEEWDAGWFWVVAPEGK